MEGAEVADKKGDTNGDYYKRSPVISRRKKRERVKKVETEEDFIPATPEKPRPVRLLKGKRNNSSNSNSNSNTINNNNNNSSSSSSNNNNSNHNNNQKKNTNNSSNSTSNILQDTADDDFLPRTPEKPRSVRVPKKKYENYSDEKWCTCADAQDMMCKHHNYLSYLSYLRS